jgi:hypothetical protein
MERSEALLAEPSPGASVFAGPDQMAGRIGLFVGGYLVLGTVWVVFATFAAIVGGNRLLVGLAAAAVAVGMVQLAEQWRDTQYDPLAVMAAFGSTLYLAYAAANVLGAAGADGRLLFWSVLLIAVPAALAMLLWMPHPILGANVALGVTVGVIGAPLGELGLSVAGAKALVLALVLAAMAAIVDLRTRSRAGSLLHYSAVAAFAVADLIIGIKLDDIATGLVVASLALGQLALALLLRRRSWAVSGWVTFTMALLSVLGASASDALFGSLVSGVAAVPLIALALQVQRHGERLRWTLLEAMPDDLAATFPR